MEYNPFISDTTFCLVTNDSSILEEYNKYGMNLTKAVKMENIIAVPTPEYQVINSCIDAGKGSLAERNILTVAGMEITSDVSIPEISLRNMEGKLATLSLVVGIHYGTCISVFGVETKGKIVIPKGNIRNLTFDDFFQIEGYDFSITELKQQDITENLPRRLMVEKIRQGNSWYDVEPDN